MALFCLYKIHVFVLCLLFVNFGICVRVGGIFDVNAEEQQLVFTLGAEAATRLAGIRVEAETELVPQDDALLVTQSICRLLGSGAIAILGPGSPSTSDHVQSLCDAMEIPHLETRRDPNPNRVGTLINIHPYEPVLRKVYMDLVKAWNWPSFTILYENAYGLLGVSELLKMYDPKGHTITIKQLGFGIDDNYRPVLQNVKKSGEHNFILECSIEKLPEVLKQAQQVGLMSDHHNYIITSLDLHTIDLEPFQFGGSNITGFRFVNPEDPDVMKATEFWNDTLMRWGRNMSDSLNAKYLKVDTALTYDALLLYALTLHELNISNYDAKIALDCEETDSHWEYGYTIVNYIKTVQHKGLTGVIKFDNKGYRSDFELDIVELTMTGLKKIGTWNSTEGLNFTREEQYHSVLADDINLQNRTFRVLTAITAPYGMLKDSAAQLGGNDQYEGFGIDLIHEMSLILGFNYTFKIQHDSVYGSYNKETKEWNGMIKELRENRADLAVTDLTITSERESGVDFTMPFMNLGISILYKKPRKMPPELFTFMAPFSSEVWFYLGVSYLGVSLLLFFMGRISPYEWTNPYPCIEEPEVLFNQFTMKNSLWFTVGSLLQQGTEIAPIAMSTRMVAGIWWFFTLIMVSSYTANLAACLTVESTISPIKNAEDLANQRTIEYGAKVGGSTASFFKDSNYSTYQKMWDYMVEDPTRFTATNDEGVNRVKNSDYAFLMESTTIEYITERNCDLTQVGGLLDDKGYGVAMRKDAPYRNALSTAVLKLQESGKLTQLKNKWWKEKRGGGACAQGESSGEADELGLPNVGGVFLVLVVGVLGSTLVAFIELLYGAMTRSYENKVPFKHELISELKFLIRCSGLTKPVLSHKNMTEDEEDQGSQKTLQSRHE